MINLSSAMGGQFAFSAAEMTAEIKRLGPNPLRGEIECADGKEAEADRENAPRDGEMGSG